MAGCSTVNLSQAIDPIGSAGTYRRIVLVEHPLPWPSDIAALPAFADAPRADGTLVLAVVPSVSGRVPASRVTVWSRDASGRFAGTELALDCAGPCSTADHLASVIDGSDDPHVRTIGAAGPQVLVCTHGRR